MLGNEHTKSLPLLPTSTTNSCSINTRNTIQSEPLQLQFRGSIITTIVNIYILISSTQTKLTSSWILIQPQLRPALPPPPPTKSPTPPLYQHNLNPWNCYKLPLLKKKSHLYMGFYLYCKRRKRRSQIIDLGLQLNKNKK